LVKGSASEFGSLVQHHLKGDVLFYRLNALIHIRFTRQDHYILDAFYLVTQVDTNIILSFLT